MLTDAELSAVLKNDPLLRAETNLMSLKELATGEIGTKSGGPRANDDFADPGDDAAAGAARAALVGVHDQRGASIVERSLGVGPGLEAETCAINVAVLACDEPRGAAGVSTLTDTVDDAFCTARAAYSDQSWQTILTWR